MKIPENAQKFIDSAKADMDKHGICYSLIEATKISYLGEESENSMVNGYYDDDKKELACVVGKPFMQWFEVFIHEYCHFLQYRVICSELSKEIKEEDEERFEDWLAGEELSESERTIIAKHLVDVEAECEATVIEVVKIFGLEDIIDPAIYTQKANAYLYFYAVLCKTGNWYDNAPYEIPEVYSICGSEFKDDYWDLPEGFRDLVNEHCYEKLE